MLRRLTVKNLAIVEDLTLELSEGLTVITGETGAGKSILVDALALVAGGRGSSDLVREGAPRLVVTGEFDVDPALQALLADAGLPGGQAVLLRRELSPDGRGRAFVEDEPASVRTLARLGERLVAIHGQSSELELADPGAPLELLDGFAKAEAERDAVGEAAAALDGSPDGAGGPRGRASATGPAGWSCSTSRYGRSRPLRRRARRKTTSRPSGAGSPTPTASGSRARRRSWPSPRAKTPRPTAWVKPRGPSRSSPRSTHAKRRTARKQRT